MTMHCSQSLRSTVLALLGALALAGTAAAAKTVIRCGDIVEAESWKPEQTHVFLIDMDAGEFLNFSIVPVGDFLKLRYAWVHDPAGSRIYSSDYKTHRIRASVGRLSARGTYRLEIRTLKAGIFHLHVGCLLRDGTEVEPTSTLALSPQNVGFRGFPGLRPLDVSGFAYSPLKLGVPAAGEIPADGDETYLFRFSGDQHEPVRLNFERTGGNLSLALVLLDWTDRVVFQSSLATTDSMTVDLTLPTTGEYTLAVAAVDLLPPEEPRPTAFEVQLSPPD